MLCMLPLLNHVVWSETFPDEMLGQAGTAEHGRVQGFKASGASRLHILGPRLSNCTACGFQPPAVAGLLSLKALLLACRRCRA